MITAGTLVQSNASGASTGTSPFAVNATTDFLLGFVFVDNLTSSCNDLTYAGHSFTNLYDNKLAATQLWVGYLTNPTQGSNNINVGFSGSVSIFRVGILPLSGVDLTTPIGGSNSATDTGAGASSLATTVTVTGASGLVVDAFYGSKVDSANAMSPQTEVMNNTGSWGGGVNHVGGSSYLAHTGSNVTMTWENFTNQAVTTKKLLYAVELLPRAASTFIPQLIML